MGRWVCMTHEARHACIAGVLLMIERGLLDIILWYILDSPFLLSLPLKSL